MKMQSKKLGPLVNQEQICNQKLPIAPATCFRPYFKKGMSTLELIIGLCIASCASALTIEVYEHLQPIAEQVSQHEIAKTEAICNFRKFKSCP